MASRRSLREYNKLNSNVDDMTDKEGEKLDHRDGHKKSPLGGTPLRKNRDEELDLPDGRKKSPIVATPPYTKKWGEKSDFHDGHEESPVVGTPTTKRRGGEFDLLDGQHIEENLGLDEKKLNDPTSIVFDYWQVIVVIVVVLVAVTLGFVFVMKGNGLSHEDAEKTIIDILKPMTKKFMSQQENLWFHIVTGLTNLFRSPVSPAVYLLLSDEKSKRTSCCVAEIITYVANRILPNDKKWLFLNGTELSKAKSRDAGVLVQSVANNVNFSRVVVVSDIHKIPGHLAAGFHFLVDQENPKIRDAVYVFTMTIDNIEGHVKPLDAVEETLFECWSDLSDNILRPLVTRVTEAVLHIVQEDEIGACPLKTDSTHEIKIL